MNDTTLPPPTDEEFSALIKPVWLSAKPSLEAQSIRATLSNDFDDGRYPTWVSDYVPSYVWDLVDIAAQRGIDAAKKGKS